MNKNLKIASDGRKEIAYFHLCENKYDYSLDKWVKPKMFIHKNIIIEKNNWIDMYLSIASELFKIKSQSAFLFKKQVFGKRVDMFVRKETTGYIKMEDIYIRNLANTKDVVNGIAQLIKIYDLDVNKAFIFFDSKTTGYIKIARSYKIICSKEEIENKLIDMAREHDIDVKLILENIDNVNHELQFDDNFGRHQISDLYSCESYSDYVYSSKDVFVKFISKNLNVNGLSNSINMLKDIKFGPQYDDIILEEQCGCFIINDRGITIKFR